MSGSETITLYRPVGPEELDLIRRSGFRSFPPRLPEQPIFYLVLTEAYAVKIAWDWNVTASGAEYVTRFSVRRSLVARYPVQNAGGSQHQEFWIPAEDSPELNENIVGAIEITAAFRAAEST
jgi:alpha-mannosidase